VDTEPNGADAPAPWAHAQLAAIANVEALLDAAGIDHWLFGGWAVDFWVGRITRPHHDVDLAVLLVDRPAIHEALLAGGWIHTPFDDEVVGTRYRRDGVLLELTFVVIDNGHVLLPFEPEAWEWSEGPFGDTRRTLHGVTARAVGLDVMLSDKSRPREGPEDAEKDRADHEALSQVDASNDAD
jgi:hypothetical protein